jgi:hypothetical protein
VQMQKEELSSASVLVLYCQVLCVWLLGSAQDARAAGKPHTWKEKIWLHYPVLKVWTAWIRLYWVNYCTVWEIPKFVSLPLLGKLGTRQYFQNVSGREIKQFTEKRYQNNVVWKKSEYWSTCPSVLHAVTLYVSPATRQTRH